MLAANGFDCENIHISIDPISGRNPGYCFVNFREADAASRALSSLQGTAIRGRPVKVGPCEPKAPATEPPGESGKHESVFQRWGNWSPPNEMDGSAATSSPGRSGPQQGPHSALEHFENVDPYQGSGGQRLYVGGLGKMINQAQNDKEIRELFADFSPWVVDSPLLSLRPWPTAKTTLASSQVVHRQANHGAREHQGDAGQSQLLLRRLRDDSRGERGHEGTESHALQRTESQDIVRQGLAGEAVRRPASRPRQPSSRC